MGALNFDDVAPSKAVSFDEVAPEKKPHQAGGRENAQLDLSGTKLEGTAIDAAAALLEQPGAMVWGFGGAAAGAYAGIRSGLLSRVPGIPEYYAELPDKERTERFKKLATMSLGDAFMEEYNRVSTNAANMYVPITPSGAKLTKAIGEVFSTAIKAYPEWQFEHTDFLPPELRAGAAATAETAIAGALMLLGPKTFKGKAPKPGEAPPRPGVEPEPTPTPTYAEAWADFKEKYPATAGKFEASSVGKIRTDDFMPTDKTVFDAVERKLDDILQLPEEKKDMTFEGKLRAVFNKMGPDIPDVELDKATRATIDGLRQLDQLREMRANERGLPLLPDQIDPAVSKEPVIVTKGGVAMTPEQVAASDTALVGMSMEERAAALGLSAMGRLRMQVEAVQKAVADGDKKAENKARNELGRNWAQNFPYRDSKKRADGLDTFINFGGRMTWEEAAAKMGPAYREAPVRKGPGKRQEGSIIIEVPEGKPEGKRPVGYWQGPGGTTDVHETYEVPTLAERTRRLWADDMRWVPAPEQQAPAVFSKGKRGKQEGYILLPDVKLLLEDTKEAVRLFISTRDPRYMEDVHQRLVKLDTKKLPKDLDDAIDNLHRTSWGVVNAKSSQTLMAWNDAIVRIDPYLKYAEQQNVIPIGRKRQRGMIEIEGLPSPRQEGKKIAAAARPWSVGSEQQERPLADKLDAAYNANFHAEEQGMKETLGDKAAQFKRGIFGHDIDLKDALEKSGPYGEKARLRMVIQTGATDAARYDADVINQQIFLPLNSAEKQMLDKLIRDKVIIEIKARDPNYRVPEGSDIDGRTAESHARQMARTLGPDNFKKLEEKADAVFNVYRQELVRGLENGLYSQETFDKLIHFNYEPTQYIDLIDPVQQFTVRGKAISIRSSGIQYLGKGKTDAAVRMDSRALLFELIARNRNREFKNNTLKSLWDLADVDPDNGLVRIQGKGQAGKHAPSGWTALGLRIEGQERQLLMKEEFAEQFVSAPQGIDHWVRNVARMASGSGVLRATAVGANPLFPAAGIPMDIAHTWAAKGAEYSSHIPVYLSQIAVDMVEVLPDLKKKSGAYADAMREGLGSHFMTAYGQEIFTREKTIAEKMAPKYEKIAKVLRGFNQEADIWIRMAHRNRLIKMGLDSWEATARARDRLDYSESGILTRSVDTVWPWTSVAMEALYKVGKSAARDPKDFGLKLAWVFGTYTAWNMGNMMASPETWKNISTSDKVRGLQITYGDQFYILDQDGNKRYMYTPLRFDQVFSPIQATVVGSLEMAQYGRLPNNLMQETMNQTFNIWNPLDGVPIVAASAAMMNFDPYTGKKIFQGTVKPEDETRPGTHPAWTATGHFTGLSPERMQAAAGKMVSPYNPWIMAAGFGLKQLLGDSDYRATARLGDQILAENLRPIVKLTNPMSGMIDSLTEAEQEEGSRRKHQTDTLDRLVFGAEHGTNSTKDVSTFIGNQPPEDRERLLHRAKSGYAIDQIMQHYEAGAAAGVPPKGWWKATAAAPGRARAQEWYSKWMSADDAGRRAMEAITVKLEEKGVNYRNDEFKRELSHERSRLGTDQR